MTTTSRTPQARQRIEREPRNRPVADRQRGLGQLARQRIEARAESGSDEHGAHRATIAEPDDFGDFGPPIALATGVPNLLYVRLCCFGRLPEPFARSFIMKVCVIGAGYVGLVTGTGFAETGNDVICADLDQSKIDSLLQGRSPIFEPGLEPMLQRNLALGTLRFSTDVAGAIAAAEVDLHRGRHAAALGRRGQPDGRRRRRRDRGQDVHR